MGNLLRADFFRLWRSKSFWACMMFQVGTGAFVPVSCYLCALLFSDLGPARSHRRRGHSTERACSSGRQYFYRQGLILVCRCSQLSGARLPVAGTPLSQGRLGYGNHPAIGPAAQGSLVWWHKQGPQQG